MEITLIEAIGVIMGVSGLNVGVIMAYINMLHKQTKEDYKRSSDCITQKYEHGKKEHERLDRRIDEISKALN